MGEALLKFMRSLRESIWTEKEESAKVKVANYGGSSLKGKKLKWHLAAENGLFW